MIHSKSEQSNNTQNQSNSSVDLQKLAHEAGERAGRYASNWGDSTTDYVHSTKNYARKNPVKTLAIVAVGGIVVGSLLTYFLNKRR